MGMPDLREEVHTVAQATVPRNSWEPLLTMLLYFNFYPRWGECTTVYPLE